MSEKTEIKFIKDLLENLKQLWLNADIELNKPANEDEIRSFENQFQVHLPSDLKEYFLRLNGISQAVNMCRLWPLNEVIRFSDFFPSTEPINPSHAFTSETEPHLSEAESYFIFGDYGFSAGYWAINLQSPSNTNPIIIAYSSQIYTRLSVRNFTEFVKSLLKDPHTLLIG